ncbi:MAG: NAD(P)-binding domain-containing protein [Chloroflexi bacterium]|nr:NAD(P)-binding domain-containing protein [Chloroflexota bacterium]
MTQTTIAIIGAGPIGLELAISLGRQNIPYILFEANQLGHEFSKWPPQTRFFSTPEHVALAGVPIHTPDQIALTSEQYEAYLRMLCEMFAVNLHNYERITAVHKQPDGQFILHSSTSTAAHQTRAQYVVFATGGLTRPRPLHIPGEELPHVTHYFPGPHKYFRTRLLVVGGKNSAMEAALRSWRAGVQVSLSYRRSALNFERIKPHLAMDIGDRLEKGEITFYPSTVPIEITPSHVVLASTQEDGSPNGRVTRLPANFVVLATGFEADMSLLAEAGVELVGEEQAPQHNPDTMETNIPGLFVAGTAAGGTQIHKFKLFISTTHHHVVNIVRTITGVEPTQVGTTTSRNTVATYEEVKAN